MNETAQTPVERLIQPVSPASSAANILLKSALVIAGVGIGAIIGLVIAIFAGLIQITC